MSDPAAFTVEPEQHLRHGQGEQFGVGQQGPSPASGAGWREVVDEDIEFGQEGFQVFRHTLILKPSA